MIFLVFLWQTEDRHDGFRCMVCQVCKGLFVRYMRHHFMGDNTALAKPTWFLVQTMPQFYDGFCRKPHTQLELQMPALTSQDT